MKQIIPVAILLLFGCQREIYEPMGPQAIPNTAFLLIKENNARLSDYNLDRLFLSYYENNQKKYVKDFSRGISGFDTLGIMCSLDIGLISADKGIKDFYIDYPDGDVDTIFADYQNISSKEAFSDPCFCTTPLKELRFNGKPAIPDTSINVADVHLLLKN